MKQKYLAIAFLCAVIQLGALALAAAEETADENPPPAQLEVHSVLSAPEEVQCSVDEIYRDCPASAPTCTPGIFKSQAATRDECEQKVMKLCKELCENAHTDRPGSCQCGTVSF